MSQDRPDEYWQRRLSKNFNLRGVGHKDFGQSYNEALYARKVQCIGAALNGIDLHGRKVLDIGCGTGFFVDWYHSRGASVTGVDITQVSVEEMKRRYPGQFVRADISEAEFDLGEAFEIVNMWDVAYHIVDEDRFGTATANIARHVAPDGRFLVTDSFGTPRDHTVAPHVRARSLATWRCQLEPFGFTLESHLPLYRLLNRNRTRRLTRRLDQLLAPVYLWLDNLQASPASNNLSLSVWRKTG
jgi:2-polyprenyl-3-methyl-5-hydroxy-6-metoxy-1,4-benzoquinol methylase